MTKGFPMSPSPVEISCCGSNKPVSDKKDGCCGDQSCPKGGCGGGGCGGRRCCGVSCCLRKIAILIIALGVLGGAYCMGMQKGAEKATASQAVATK
jgi:hypothetical protein